MKAKLDEAKAAEPVDAELVKKLNYDYQEQKIQTDIVNGIRAKKEAEFAKSQFEKNTKWYEEHKVEKEETIKKWKDKIAKLKEDHELFKQQAQNKQAADIKKIGDLTKIAADKLLEAT